MGRLEPGMRAQSKRLGQAARQISNPSSKGLHRVGQAAGLPRWCVRGLLEAVLSCTPRLCRNLGTIRVVIGEKWFRNDSGFQIGRHYSELAEGCVQKEEVPVVPAVPALEGHRKVKTQSPSGG